MLTVIARLQRGEAVLREASAWMIPGDDAQVWLNEVSCWPVPIEQVSFYVLAALDGGSVVGVLAVPPSGVRIERGGRGQPYGEVVPGLFLPVDAQLSAQIDALPAGGAAFALRVWHPALGLVAFEPYERRGAWDFLAAPQFAADSWDGALSAVPVVPRLTGVRLVQTLTAEDVFGDESRDIGRESPDSIAPMQGEPGRSIGERLGQGALVAGMKALLWLSALVPRGATSPTWVNHLENWASSKLGRLLGDVEKSRHHELHRLIELMKNAPDEGLRHAISLAALAHRGKATPSGKLGRRSLDFNVNRLGGGGARDFWDVPGDVQASLARSYREAAQREHALGRHRRAAYIYAELLGDLSSAAEVLKQGKHFLEAALLYRERLAQPLLAAECLAECGRSHEAVEIFARHRCWLRLAALHEKLGDTVAAREALRRQVAEHLAAHDVLAASKLLETRLGRPEEALELLISTWPDGRQWLVCLEERVGLLERMGRTEDLVDLCGTLGRDPLASKRVASVVAILGKLSANAKVDDVRRSAAEAVRVRVSSALLAGRLDRVDELAVLKALTRLVPNDRLLTRDVTRFRTRANQVEVAPRLVEPRQTGLVLQLTLSKGRTFSLPHGGRWLRVVGDLFGYRAVAMMEKDKIVVARGGWAGSQQSVEWTDPEPSMGSVLVFKDWLASVVVARPLGERLRACSMPQSDYFQKAEMVVGTPDWLPADVVQVAEYRFVLWAVRVVSGRIVLVSFQGATFAEAKLLYTRDVTDELVAAGAMGAGSSVLLDARGAPNSVALGYGTALLVMGNERELRTCPLGARIIDLLPLSESAPGWIVVLERGLAWVTASSLEVTMLDHEMECPRVTVVRAGAVVAVAGRAGKVYQRLEGAYLETGRFTWDDDDVLAITGSDKHLEFVAFHANGSAQCWTLPAS